MARELAKATKADAEERVEKGEMKALDNELGGASGQHGICRAAVQL